MNISFYVSLLCWRHSLSGKLTKCLTTSFAFFLRVALAAHGDVTLILWVRCVNGKRFSFSFAHHTYVLVSGIWYVQFPLKLDQPFSFPCTLQFDCGGTGCAYHDFCLILSFRDYIWPSQVKLASMQFNINELFLLQGLYIAYSTAVKLKKYDGDGCFLCCENDFIHN